MRLSMPAAPGRGTHLGVPTGRCSVGHRPVAGYGVRQQLPRLAVPVDAGGTYERQVPLTAR